MPILRTAAALCLLAAVAHTLPSSSVVPEAGLIQAKAAHSAAAVKVQALLQAGQTEDDCKKLADDTITDVAANVQTTQNELDELDKGYDCKKEGQDAVADAEKKKEEADERAKTADEAYEVAKTAPVQLEPQLYSFLKTGECSWIKSDPNYLKAMQTYEDAVKEKTEAHAAAQAAATALENAINEAARLKKECECRVKSEHEAAWTAANENKDANDKAWTQAHNMQCVLEHKTYDNCQFDPTPTLTKPVVDPEVESAECNEEEHPYEEEQCARPECPENCWLSTPCRYKTKEEHPENQESCFHKADGTTLSCSCDDKYSTGEQRYEMPHCP